jgi:Uma2 family endonuclease
MTALLKPPVDLDKETRQPPSRCIVLYDVPWESYKAIRTALPERQIYMTHDGGVLEIMVMHSEHEFYKSLLRLAIFVLARFFRKKVRCAGSLTHQRDDIQKALEPDECFYLASYSKVKGKKHIDLMRDPPPDLAVEVDITASRLNRLWIYAALGVAEVWHFNADALRVLLLKEGQYEAHDKSPTFPGIAVADLLPMLEIGIEQDETAMVDALEKWLKRSFPKRKGKKP